MDSNHTCQAIFSLDSALKNYYPQVFMKECKYIDKKVIRHISGFSCDDNSNEEY